MTDAPETPHEGEGRPSPQHPLMDADIQIMRGFAIDSIGSGAISLQRQDRLAKYVIELANAIATLTRSLADAEAERDAARSVSKQWRELHEELIGLYPKITDAIKSAAGAK